MLITKRTYKKNTLLEELISSIPLGTLLGECFLSNAAKQLASAALQAGKSQQKILEWKKAIDVAKTHAVNAGKNLVEMAPKKLSTSKSQVANVMVPPEEITKKVNEDIAKYVDTGAIILNKLIDGSSVNCPTASNAIAVQDLIRRINGPGLKVTYIFLSFLKNDGWYITIYPNPIIDESIEEHEYHEYDPITGTNDNSGRDIRISIESQDMVAHPSESNLIFEGRLTKADNTAYANADEIALTNNALLHLFSRIEYHLSNQLIESLHYPGQATIMLGLLKYPDHFSKAQGIKTQQQLQLKLQLKSIMIFCKACISHPVTNCRRCIFF